MWLALLVVLLGCRTPDPAWEPLPTADTGPAWTLGCPEADPERLRNEADLRFETYVACDLDPDATQLCLREHAVGWRADLGELRPHLFLFLPPGPGLESLRIRRWAAYVGYRTIVLGYVNDGDLTDACADSDGTCHADWRHETHAGDDRSEHLTIGPADSIEGRTQALLNHLADNDPDGLGWSDFVLDDGTVRWDRIVVSGWSIGAGQAAWIAHERPVRGALLLSGPKDRAEIDGVRQPAPWIAEPVQVAPERLFGIYHRDEEGAAPPNLLLDPAWSAMGMPAGEHDPDEGTGELDQAHRLRFSRDTDRLAPGCDPHGAIGRDGCMRDNQMAPYTAWMCAAGEGR